MAGEVAVHVDEPCGALSAQARHAGVVVAEPAHLLRPQARALEIARAVGGVVDVRHQEQGAWETKAQGLEDPVEAIQDGADASGARAIGGPDEAEEVVAARGQGDDGLRARIGRRQPSSWAPSTDSVVAPSTARGRQSMPGNQVARSRPANSGHTFSSLRASREAAPSPVTGISSRCRPA